MTDGNLTLIFDGPAVENGEIDVQDLAPALLAVGDLIQSANNEINGTRAQVSVRVKATAAGSFEVDLALLQSLAESAKSLFDFSADNKDGIAATNELADLIFKIIVNVAGGVTVIGGGLFALIKFLKGRKPEKIEPQSGGDVHIHINGNVFVTNQRTVQLAENVTVRENAKKAIATLSKDGINTMKFRRPDRETLEVSKGEVGYFEITDREQELDDVTRTMLLQIISLSFKEDNKWRVTDGGEPFSATIEDVAFLNRISNNEESFAKGDYLNCRVRERQFQTNKGLRKERSIIEVLEHRPAAQQTRLL